jgi:hypothetical protein
MESSELESILVALAPGLPSNIEMCCIIFFHTFAQAITDVLGKYSGIRYWNL